MLNFDVLYEDNHIIVVNKPFNVPVQKDSSNDLDLVTMVKKYLKEKYNKPGNVYLGLVHRLDRPVGGVMVFARTSKAASRLSKAIREDQFIKKYYAVVRGKVKDSDKFVDYISKDPNTFNGVISNKGKYSELSYKLIGYKNGLSLVDILLKTGRHHQIRVQFASRGYPLYGDQRYGIEDKEQISLFSYYLEFIHPVKKEKVVFKLDMPKLSGFLFFN